MTLTFGIATWARRGPDARRPMGAIGATRGMSTTTWAMTLRAGTRKGSAAQKRATSTATSPAMPGTAPGGRRRHRGPPGSRPACPTAAGTAATRARARHRGDRPARVGIRGHRRPVDSEAPAGLRAPGGDGPGGPAGRGGREARGASADRGAAGWTGQPGQGQGQLVAALDGAQGPGRAAGVVGACHRARRDRRWPWPTRRRRFPPRRWRPPASRSPWSTRATAPSSAGSAPPTGRC